MFVAQSRVILFIIYISLDPYIWPYLLLLYGTAYLTRSFVHFMQLGLGVTIEQSEIAQELQSLP